MGLIMWDKPKQIMSAKDREETFIFDGGPPGGYMSNMSKADQSRWKGKVVGTKRGRIQIEVRKDCAVFIFAGKHGYVYKHYDNDDPYTLHIGVAGSILWNQRELDEFIQVVAEARAKLAELELIH